VGRRRNEALECRCDAVLREPGPMDPEGDLAARGRTSASVRHIDNAVKLLAVLLHLGRHRCLSAAQGEARAKTSCCCAPYVESRSIRRRVRVRSCHD